jgi:hypothetical protein
MGELGMWEGISNLRVTRLACALALSLCAMGCNGDDEDGDGHHGGDGDGDHHGPDGTCGLQANCPDFDPVTLAENLLVEGDDEVFMAHVTEHEALSVDDNAIKVMIMDEDGAVADAEVKAGTYSLDCGHPGPSPAENLTTNAMGMVDIAPVFAHGGPWDIELEVSEGGRSDTVKITLCVPGADHPGGAAGGGMHH